MNNHQLMKGIGIGLAVGAAIGAACIPMKKHPMKKKAKHAFKVFSEAVEDLSDVMGL